MRTKSLLFAGLIVVSLFSGSVASAQVSCSGLPAFASCTAYANGTAVTYNGSKYTTIAPIPNNRDCPPNSPYTPATDNWWTNNGTCSTTATATATRAATATATRTATATPTTGGSTATATRAATSTATRTATATPTSGGPACSPTWNSGTIYTGGNLVSRLCGSQTENFEAAFWTQGNDPCTNRNTGGNGEEWFPRGACGGGGNPTATATRTPTATPTTGGPTATRTSTATATPTTGGGNGFPARFSAPYVAVWNNPNLGTLATQTGHKFWTLAFIINGGGTCNPLWNGDTALSNTFNVAGLRSQGGDVIISFGGAGGVEIARSCGDVASLQAAYQKVINAMSLKVIDLDIETGSESDTVSVDRRNKAMKNLQSANPGLRVNYTLAVDRAGLPGAQINLLKNAVSNGVTVSSVNIMAMDYGPCYSDMGQAAVDAANATRNQLSSNGLNMAVGITPMIGVNDVTCENFTTNDANVTVNFAQGASFVNLLAYWEQSADSSRSYINIFKNFH